MKKFLGNNSIRSLIKLIQKKFREVEGNLSQIYTELNSSISTHTHNTASYTNNGLLASVDKIKIDSIVKCGLIVTSLNELVESIMGQSQGQFRTSQGTITIPNGILSFINGTSASWCQFYASWQNHYSNTQYDINLNILIITSTTDVNEPYMVHIEGKNGSYNVVSEESLLPITKTEVNELKKSVSDGKSVVANAITAKGITTAANAEFATMAANVSKIKTTPNLQQKSVALNTGTSLAVINPDSGYDGLSQVTASVSLQEKTQTLLHGSVTVTPDNGKVLSKVAVNGPANKGGVTVNAGAVTQDSTYTYFGIPAAGYYDTNSKLRSANSNLLGKQYFGAGVYASASGNSNNTGYGFILIDMTTRSKITLTEVFSNNGDSLDHIRILKANDDYSIGTEVKNVTSGSMNVAKVIDVSDLIGNYYVRVGIVTARPVAQVIYSIE